MKRRRAPKSAAPEADLPAAYGRTCLTLLDVDPFHVHAAWEITPHDRDTTEKKYTDTFTAYVWLLRFYDEGDGSTFDIPIDPGIHSWYVELWAAHKTYHAELGLCTVHGVFESLCRSNTITTPPAAPAPQQEPQWLAVTGALEQAQMVNAPAAEAEESSQRSEISDQQAEVGPELAVAPGSTAQDFPLCEPPHAGVATPVVVAAELEPPAALAAVLEEKPASSAAPTPETAPAGSSEGVSSFSMGGGVGKAAIELELHAEVVVYGRAQPGQTLRVNGRPVPVNDDGTFHVRWALPVTKP